jgi:hypothetical protein
MANERFDSNRKWLRQIPDLPSVHTTSSMSRLTRIRARATADGATPWSGSASPLRRQVLRDNLLPTVELLNRRQTSLVRDGFIADYLALNWLVWNGGTLHLTVAGNDVCEQLKAGPTANERG